MIFESFKSDCMSLDPEDVVQKHLLDGSAYFFDNDKTHNEYTFKKELACSLDAHIRDIAIVGSGKLGFSIKPDQDLPGFYPFKKFDSNPEKPSDLDIAIISSRIFDEQLINLYNHTSRYTNNVIWNENSHKKSLAYYILKGWLKPEFIPKDYLISTSVNDVRATYKSKFGRDINIGIYKSWFFFEKYHQNNIYNIQLNLMANGK